MRERPILFSGPMVRALLEGRKTQTRRVLKPQPPTDWKPSPHLAEIHRCVDGEPVEPRSARDVIGWGWAEEDGHLGFCAPCLPGDLLWVRETWTPVQGEGGAVFEGHCVYRADACDKTGQRWHSIAAGDPDREVRWKPAIHMPRRLSRLTLSVTAVRVERLQDISEADAINEGIDHRWSPARGCFSDLWNSLNGPGAWTANPWVAVINFKRVQ